MQTYLFALRMWYFAVRFNSDFLPEYAKQWLLVLRDIRAKDGFPQALLSLEYVLETRVLWLLN